MVIVKLSAGLGNQMFQYALGRRLSLDWDDTLLFDISWFATIKKGETPRDLEINTFNIDIIEADLKDINEAKPIFFVKMLNKVKGRINRNYFYSFHSNVLRKRKNIFIDGYFQSYKYFDTCREILIKDFVLKDGFSVEGLEIKEVIEHSNQSVALHIRRGDFASSCIDWNGLCSIEYYKKALNEIKKEHTDVTVFVFSDDIEWAIENLTLNVTTFFVSKPSFEPAEELLLMSLCDHQIIANSTFSWWAAWLNKNKKKIVIAPSRWLVTSKINTDDLIPPDWIKI